TCACTHDSINLNVDESTIPSDPIIQSVDINTKSTSYTRVAGASAKDQPKVNSHFCTLVADLVFDGVTISIPRKVVEKVSTHFEHTLYGYFIEKRMAFLVVEYHARNNWAKHGLKRIMMNSKVDTRLLKEELTRILMWVKLHDIPIQVFEEDGISLIAMFIRKPVMLDSYTSSMCNESWGRSSFARCLIEVNLEADLVDVVTIGGESSYRYYFNVVTPTVEKTNNGVHAVGKKKKRKATTSAPKKGFTNVGNTSQWTSMLKMTGYSSKKDNLSMSNSFSALNDEEEDDEEDVQNVYNELANLLQNTKAGGSSSFTAIAG
ncbi:zinc knuckle CX2CX4HX4C containing protein, partial [Tanacetum coccineum]